MTSEALYRLRDKAIGDFKRLDNKIELQRGNYCSFAVLQNNGFVLGSETF